MYLVVGLGNPGAEYESTRHNVGFMVIEHIAQAHRVKLGTKSHAARWGQGELAGKTVILAEPMTYMNESGVAVKSLLKDKGIPVDHLIVVYDDLDLEPGRIRVRANGGSGGHKGIKSIISQIGTEQFIRVRVGIGRPPGRQDPADYVLSPFTKNQREEINFAIAKASDAVEYIIANGVTLAMNEFNRKDDDGG
ncbi:MAG: aminoacyl-tRNA hydrolase [Firmicutes bacterium]|nr:aminoacyl-tRNA hydrolase [Bacillota bacterium]